jgi:hypothetical protein
MPVNASPHYERAEKEYLDAQTTEQKIKALKKMLALSPKHKSAENLNAQLKRRLAKLKYSKEKESKKKISTKKGIKKEDTQAVIIGLTNSGKSSLLSGLTNTNPLIASGEFSRFTTKKPEQGMLNYAGAQIQIIENPAVNSEYYDKGITNTADTVLILLENLEDLKKIEPFLEKARGKKIFVFNKVDLLDEISARKLKATLQSKRYNFVLISAKTKEGLAELREVLFKSFPIVRIFTKEPGKPKSEKPVILQADPTVKDVAEKISKGFSRKITEAKIWGPSSKFPGQKVGLNHILKNLDIVEFKTR